MFTDRNVKMTEKIEGYLQSEGTFFVIVGAGHLVGDDSVVSLLQKKHKVER